MDETDGWRVMDYRYICSMNQQEEYYYQMTKFVLGQISCYDETYAYPKYHITCDAKVVFRTLDDAEDWMDDRATDEEWQPELHHFIVEQRRYGEPYGRGLPKWLYDRNGKRMDCTISRHIGNTITFKPRFKKGDIVELITVNLKEQTASIAIVVDAPERDTYLIADSIGAKPRKVSCVDVMPTRYPISDNLKKYLHKCLETANDDNSERHQECIEHGFGLGEFGALIVSLDVEPETLVPHLHISDKDDRLMVSLQLDRPEYFPHEGRFTARLQKWQKQALMEYLMQNDCGKPRWWYMLRRFREWYDDHNLNLSPDLPLPDYTKLPE